MASIGIADKETLDSVKQDTVDILSRIGSGGSGSTVNLANVQVFILDFVNDDITMHNGAIDAIRRIATT